MGVESVLGKIVADLYPIIRMNLTNSVLSESPKFKSLRLPAVNATDIRNLNFAPSTRAKMLSGTRRDKGRDTRLGYTYYFEKVSETTAFRNHIKNSELETREVLERETRIFHRHDKRIW